jgi:hypothetical protein
MRSGARIVRARNNATADEPALTNCRRKKQHGVDREIATCIRVQQQAAHERSARESNPQLG